MDEQLEKYLLEHTSPQGEYLDRLCRESHLRMVNGQMVSGPLQGRLLKMLVQMARPKNVLELGTFTGFSALSMAEGLAEDARLTTIEHNDELEDFIQERFDASPHGKKIRLIIGDACEELEKLDEEFDLVFMDADKRDYDKYYRLVMPRLRPGGYILADNTLWYGHVVETEYDHDAQTLGIRRFNDLVAADEQVEQVIIPLRDGLTVIRKKETN